MRLGREPCPTMYIRQKTNEGGDTWRSELLEPEHHTLKKATGRLQSHGIGYERQAVIPGLLCMMWRMKRKSASEVSSSIELQSRLR